MTASCRRCRYGVVAPCPCSLTSHSSLWRASWMKSLPVAVTLGVSRRSGGVSCFLSQPRTHAHIPTPASLASRALFVGVVLLFCGSDDMKTKALKVLFGLGLVRGSLPNILLVVDVLLLRKPSFAIKVQYSPPLLCESNLPPHPPTQHLLPINTQHPTHTHRPFGPTSTPDVHRVEAACHLAP